MENARVGLLTRLLEVAGGTGFLDSAALSERSVIPVERPTEREVTGWDALRFERRLDSELERLALIEPEESRGAEVAGSGARVGLICGEGARLEEEAEEVALVERRGAEERVVARWGVRE